MEKEQKGLKLYLILHTWNQGEYENRETKFAFCECFAERWRAKEKVKELRSADKVLSHKYLAEPSPLGDNTDGYYNSRYETYEVTAIDVMLADTKEDSL